MFRNASSVKGPDSIFGPPLLGTEEMLESALFSPRSVEFPPAWVEHIPFAFWLVGVLRPSTFVELGTHSGNSYFAICQAVNAHKLATKCFAVDTWLGDEHAGRYGEEVFARVCEHNDANYAEFSVLVRSTFDDALKHFPDGSIDLLHIDGQHGYESCRHDFESWLPKLSDRSVVLFHDTNVRKGDFGVFRLWSELSLRYPSFEFLHGHGLGVLAVGGSIGAKLRALFAAGYDFSKTHSIREIFWRAAAEARARGRLRVHERELAQLNGELAGRDQRVAELTRQLDEGERNLRAALEGVSSRDADISSLRGSLRATVTQHEAELSDLSIRLAERETKVLALEAQLAASLLEISELAAEHSRREESLKEVTRARLDSDAQGEMLAEEVRKLKTTAQGLQEERADRDYQIGRLNKIIWARDNAINMLHQSTSWRITAPLRWVATRVLAMVSTRQSIALYIKRLGGLARTAQKMFHLGRREGVPGIWKRIRYVGRAGLDEPPSHVLTERGFDYLDWVKEFDTTDERERAAMHRSMNQFRVTPRISILLPTYNSNREWLTEAIDSVRHQIYPNWELCIADDASNDTEIRELLKEYSLIESRIKVLFRPTNGHISSASNSALSLATGEWVGLLDHDDVLNENALFWIVDAINRNSDARLIYSDEDKIDETGKRKDPYFKCAWNVDLFYSHNMISHLGVYFAAVVREIGGFREGLEGSQDYDLALRFIERIEPTQICHVPRVLYHWRMHNESTARDADAKPYAMLAGERALNDHFLRVGIRAKAELMGHGYRVRYGLPSDLPLVSVVIPTRDGLQYLRSCVSSILEKTSYANYEVLVIDNGSVNSETLQYLDGLEDESRIRVIRDARPFNYSALNNAAVRLCRGSIIVLLNNDIEVISRDWLEEMVSIAVQPKVGAVGARLWFMDGTLQHGGVILGLGASRVAGHAHYRCPKGNFGYFGRASLTQSMSAVSAACLAIRKQVYEEVGGLDEANLQVAFNDVDFCLRVREAGYRNVWTAFAEMFHRESATRGYEDNPDKAARFEHEANYMKRRWGELLTNDPAYSPNLTLDRDDFWLAWPPRVKRGSDFEYLSTASGRRTCSAS